MGFLVHASGRKPLSLLTDMLLTPQTVAHDLEKSARPMVQTFIKSLNSATAPLQDIFMQHSEQIMGKMAGVLLSPLFAQLLSNVQLVSGAVALSQVVHVTTKITASCVRGKERQPTFKALTHVQRCASPARKQCLAPCLLENSVNMQILCAWQRGTRCPFFQPSAERVRDAKAVFDTTERYFRTEAGRDHGTSSVYCIYEDTAWWWPALCLMKLFATFCRRDRS